MQSLVDDQGLQAVQDEATKAKDAIEAGDWQAATDYWGSTEWVVIEQTHGVDFYNILKFVRYWGTDDTETHTALRMNHQPITSAA